MSFKDTKLQENPWQILSTNTKYENNWLRVDHHDVVNPAGNPGIYGTVHFKNLAVGVVVLDDENNTYLVGQYRFPLGQYSWEIPEGGAPLDQDPLEMAMKELKEETGLTARNWIKLAKLHTSNSATDEAAIIYLASGIETGIAEPEETEILNVKKIPFTKYVEMIEDGEITDAISVCAGLLTYRWLNKQIQKT